MQILILSIPRRIGMRFSEHFEYAVGEKVSEGHDQP